MRTTPTKTTAAMTDADYNSTNTDLTQPFTREMVAWVLMALLGLLTIASLAIIISVVYMHKTKRNASRNGDQEPPQYQMENNSSYAKTETPAGMETKEISPQCRMEDNPCYATTEKTPARMETREKPPQYWMEDNPCYVTTAVAQVTRGSSIYDYI